MSTPASVRIDKWLWAARFFKTRPLAAEACELGRITSNGQVAKPAREVKLGDTLAIRNESGDFVIEVRELSDTRGPATAAQALYHESDSSREARAKAAEVRKAQFAMEILPVTRPTSKRDRRNLSRVRGRG